jgi:polar amino acid transport system substrate-binding protein
MKTLLKVLHAAAVTVAVAAPTMLLSASYASAESTLHTVLERKKLIVGTTYDSPPTGYLDAQGNVLGYAPDLGRYIAKRLGVGLEFVQVTASTRVPLLTTGRIDVEIAVTTPQKVRNEVVDFTYAHIWDDGVLLVRKGSSLNPDDYRTPDKIIGGTQGNGFVENWKAAYPEAKFKLFREEPEVVAALQNGDVDAYLVNSFTGARFAREADGLTVSKPWKRSEDALMVRQDDSKWRNWLNWTLQRMWAEGTIKALYNKWYGSDPGWNMGDNGELQQRVEIIGKTDDPWQPLPDGFMDTLLSDKSYTLQ